MKTKVPTYCNFSSDLRKRRRQHRRAARYFANEGGNIAREMKHWHLQQAKFLSY